MKLCGQIERKINFEGGLNGREERILPDVIIREGGEKKELMTERCD